MLTRWKRHSLPLLLLAGLAATPSRAQAGSSTEWASKVKVGSMMPSIVVQQIDGKTFSLEKLRGKVVVVNFWATWCGPCMLEMPRLESDLWQRYKSSPDFAMVAIAREQDTATISAFRSKHPAFTFPMAVDPHRTTYKLFADAGIPRTYLVGRDGRVLYETLGGDPADMTKLLDKLKEVLAR